MKKCPFCAELIQDEAIKCRYCGETLNHATPPPALRPAPPADPTDPTTFSGAIRSAFQQYSSATGRASRLEYWWYALFAVLSVSVSGFLSQGLAGLVLLVIIVPSICAAIRRLHDLGQSGASLLWVFVPVLGNLYLLFLLASRGNPNANAYGEPPLGSRGASADTASAPWNPPKVSSETLWLIGGLAALIGLLAWLPGFMRQASNLDEEMKDTMVAVGSAQLQYKMAHGTYTSDWEALSQEFSLTVPGGLWVTLYASNNAFCAEVENQRAREGDQTYASTRTEGVERREDGSIWVSSWSAPCPPKVLTRIRNGSTGNTPLPAVSDWEPTGGQNFDNFTGRWLLDDPVRYRWLEINSDGSFTLIKNPGSPAEEVLRGTSRMDFSFGMLGLYEEGSDPYRDFPLGWGALVQFADPALGFGVMLVDLGSDCPLRDPTCHLVLQSAPGTPMPVLNSAMSPPIGSVGGTLTVPPQLPVLGYPAFAPPVVNLDPPASYSDVNYFGSWIYEGVRGSARIDINPNGDVLYVHDPGGSSESVVPGTWEMGEGLLILYPDEGEPASVALVILGDGDSSYALLFTMDDCGVVDLSCGQLFVWEGDSRL